MALSTGARLGSYEIVSPLGVGGMGEVWRARDTKLGREVALKILPALFAADPERLARFRQEARLLASLNHPHIGAIYGLEESNGVDALILELVDGPTLADRIAQAPLPLDEALAIARQIADALEAAHEQGIVHRDLKPSNIKLRPDGTVKVLDFGLAKALEPAGSTTRDPRESPTLTALATQLGVIVGTAAYMAPEQARGRLVDKRADVWAFGVVLYEMLTGRRAFEGEDVSDTLAFVLTREPDWSALPASTPTGIRRLLRRSLEKESRKRLADIRDARLELDDGGADAPAPSPPHATSRRERVMWASLAAALALTAAAATMRSLRPVPASPELRVDIVTPRPLDSSLAISPDGRKVAFVAEQNNRWRLWVRALDSGVLRPLPGTEGGRLPFWSSDSASIGFFTEGQMKRVDIAGGSPQVLAPIVTPGGGTWHGDTILFAPNSSVGPILRMAAGGGEPVPVTRPSDREVGHRHPQFLPDGRHFLYAANIGGSLSRIHVGDLSGSPPVSLLEADGSPVYSGSGHLLFVRNGTLFGQEFDPATQSLRRTPVPIAEDVAVSGTLVQSAISASATGAIVYRTGAAVGRRRLIWFDRAGSELERLPDGDLSGISNPWSSPDGRRLAVHAMTNGNVDVWILDLPRGVYSRFTSHPAPEALPIWSPDGRHIVFTSLRGGTADLHMKTADGSGTDEPLVTLPGNERPSDWSRDGRMLLFKTSDPSHGSSDIWALPLDDPKKAFVVVGSPADERDAQFSPDARWIAFQSDESGRPEIYVQRFPGPGGKERISNAGGTQVRWRADGKELFYVDTENALTAVPITLPSGQGAPDIGTPARLFSARLVQAGLAVARQQYVVSPDGAKFLANTIEEPPTGHITLLLNWKGR
jgi:serine/threonine protein kinase